MSRKIIVALMSNALEPFGFSFSQSIWSRTIGEQIHTVQIQKRSTAQEYTFNVGVTDTDVWKIYWGEPAPLFIDEARCGMRSRIGHLFPEQRDVWWKPEGFDDATAQKVSRVAIDFFSQNNDRSKLLEHLRDRRFLEAASQPYIPLLIHLLGDTNQAVKLLRQLKSGDDSAWGQKLERIAQQIELPSH
jgi:hypothetical protein